MSEKVEMYEINLKKYGFRDSAYDTYDTLKTERLHFKLLSRKIFKTSILTY